MHLVPDKALQESNSSYNRLAGPIFAHLQPPEDAATDRIGIEEPELGNGVENERGRGGGGELLTRRDTTLEFMSLSFESSSNPLQTC